MYVRLNVARSLRINKNDPRAETSKNKFPKSIYGTFYLPCNDSIILKSEISKKYEP